MGASVFDFLQHLSGQPVWVMIVIAVLSTVGTVGTAWLTRGTDRSRREVGADEQDRPQLDNAPPPALSSAADAHTTLIITKALDLLANEAVESQEARRETERLRSQLGENEQLRAELTTCDGDRSRLAAELARVRAELDACNLECRRLALKALGMNEEDGQ